MNNIEFVLPALLLMFATISILLFRIVKSTKLSILFLIITILCISGAYIYSF